MRRRCGFKLFRELSAQCVLIGITLLALRVAAAQQAPDVISTHSKLAPIPARELSADIWDWTPPARDLRKFEAWAKDLKELGFRRLELSVPWSKLEPEPGRFDLTWLRERAAICKQYGLGMRLRINSHFLGATPRWYKGDFLQDATGRVIAVGGSVPSINDDRFWEHYGALCSRIAEGLRGQDVLYNPFIGIHAELKYADWWTFDPSSLKLWREQTTLSPRPEWLRSIVGDDGDLPTTPSVPKETRGTPDLGADSRAFIAFREWTWRRAMERFRVAIRAGDPEARISSPLGESFRRESAFMSNLDYWGLSRNSCEVVHSYDFYVHPGSTPLWHVAATLASFQGITGKPIVFEFDSPETIQNTGYDVNIQKDVARAAFEAGAGLKFANFSYHDRLPSSWPVIKYASELARAGGETTAAVGAQKQDVVLLFFSKWSNYCYRDSTEWLHDAQFGWWKLLSDCGIPTRIICEDNLEEDLSGYRGLIVASSPEGVLPAKACVRLKALPLPRICDYTFVPTLRSKDGMVLTGEAGILELSKAAGFASITDIGGDKECAYCGLSGKEGRFVGVGKQRVVLGFALGYQYLHNASKEACVALAHYCMRKSGIEKGEVLGIAEGNGPRLRQRRD